MSNPEASQRCGLSRRQLLLRAAGAFLAAALSGDSAPLVTPKLQQRNYAVARAPFYKVRQPDLEQVDTVYLSRALHKLQQESGTVQERVKAVQGALRTVRWNGLGTPYDMGSAVEIDESGIYLTANHIAAFSTSALLGQVKLAINNPVDGAVMPVQATLKHSRADVAILYASTGKAARVTPGLAMRTTPLADREQLWLLGFHPVFDASKTEVLYEVEHTGWVDNSVQFETVTGIDKNFPSFVQEEGSEVLVRELIPYGGTSGSPIIDNQGFVRGIESGVYLKGANKVENYLGAKIVPLSYVNDLPSENPLRYDTP